MFSVLFGFSTLIRVVQPCSTFVAIMDMAKIFAYYKQISSESSSSINMRYVLSGF